MTSCCKNFGLSLGSPSDTETPGAAILFLLFIIIPYPLKNHYNFHLLLHGLISTFVVNRKIGCQVIRYGTEMMGRNRSRMRSNDYRQAYRVWEKNLLDPWNELMKHPHLPTSPRVNYGFSSQHGRCLASVR
jgi:hypothetical protein